MLALLDVRGSVRYRPEEQRAHGCVWGQAITKNFKNGERVRQVAVNPSGNV